tara:strand:- start:1921 stop:2136 length:216 start_codon:yes stop_codon:yes gene_type:complete
MELLNFYQKTSLTEQIAIAIQRGEKTYKIGSKKFELPQLQTAGTITQGQSYARLKATQVVKEYEAFIEERS